MMMNEIDMIALWPCLRKKPDSKANCTTAEIESVFQICDVCELFFPQEGARLVQRVQSDEGIITISWQPLDVA